MIVHNNISLLCSSCKSKKFWFILQLCLNSNWKNLLYNLKPLIVQNFLSIEEANGRNPILWTNLDLVSRCFLFSLFYFQYSFICHLLFVCFFTAYFSLLFLILLSIKLIYLVFLFLDPPLVLLGFPFCFPLFDHVLLAGPFLSPFDFLWLLVFAPNSCLPFNCTSSFASTSPLKHWALCQVLPSTSQFPEAICSTLTF